MGDSLTVKEGDAHAWIEVWSEQLGWMPLDLTPENHRSLGSIWNYYEGIVDWMSAKWSKNFVTFDRSRQAETLEAVSSEASEQANTWKDQIKKRVAKIESLPLIVFTLATIGIVGLVGYLVFRYLHAQRLLRGSRKYKGAPLSLQKRRRKLYALMQRVGLEDLGSHTRLRQILSDEKDWTLSLKEWLLIDEELRFQNQKLSAQEQEIKLQRLDEIWNGNSKIWEENLKAAS